MDKIAILIPCFNEAKTIQKVVSDFIVDLPLVLAPGEKGHSESGEKGQLPVG